MEQLEKIFPKSRQVLGELAWRTLTNRIASDAPVKLVEFLDNPGPDFLPDYLPDLARVEWITDRLIRNPDTLPDRSDAFILNPNLEVLSQNFTLSGLFANPPALPEKRVCYLMIWRHPESGKVLVGEATEQEILALKIVVDDLDISDIAQMRDVSNYKIRGILHQAADRGLLLPPVSKICRDELVFPLNDADPKFIHADYFTIQWHITHACDLHCKHCYDRSHRSLLTLEQGKQVIDQLVGFCENRNVRGHVCFTGGNPFLSPHFEALYQYAANQELGTSILANPVDYEKVKRISDIQMPAYYQVSLEGLAEHNDSIRGEGNFYNVIEFLGVLRDLHIKSAIMLTLTKDNLIQVLPLAKRLRGHVDQFTFNRLSPVGEGAGLQTVAPETYESFLRDYIEASRNNPILRFKENLINIIRSEQGLPLYGGCTGYGCGAAFSFVAILPDGEVHACRKFPSLIGNIHQKTLAEIYDSELAVVYRRGAAACRECKLRPGCGGCMAVVNGYGKDVFQERDPCCFYKQNPETIPF